MLNINQPAINPRLTAAMKAMQEHNTEETRSKVAAELMEAKLLAPIQRQTNLVSSEERVRFRLIQNEKKEKYYMVFSDMSQLYKWNKGLKQDTVQVMFGDLVKLMEENPSTAGFVVNPMGENVTITKTLANSLWKQKNDKQGI